LKDETESFLCIEKLDYACTHAVRSWVRLILVVPQCIKKKVRYWANTILQIEELIEMIRRGIDCA
jgi:hypothetical protein